MSTESVNIALFGAAGKMGREILRVAEAIARVRVQHGYDVHRVGELIEGCTIEAVAHELPHDVQVVVDFSSPTALTNNLALAMKARVPYVSGVTGFLTDPKPAFERAAKEIAVLHSANFSLGMNVMLALAAQAVKTLPDYKRYITEIHHTAKKDSPSGTALRIADAIYEVTQQDTEISSLRLGDVVGEHRLLLGGPGERLEIVHRADSRSVFANGALRVAEWILGREPGMYSVRNLFDQ